MATQAGAPHLYFQTQRREVTGYESGIAETANECSFDSVVNTSNLRDVSIQQGDGHIRRPRTNTSNNRSMTNGNRKKISDKYVSPFILSAEKRAQERARQYQESKRKARRPEWDDHLAPTGSLFDPTIHKQEIFRLQPRRKTGDGEHRRSDTQQQHQRPPATHVKHHEEEAVTFKPNGWSRMTIKTSGVSC